VSSARRVRRKLYALEVTRINSLLSAEPLSDEEAAIREAMLADRDLQDTFDRQENERRWARRRRSLAATAQILVTVATVLGLGAVSTAVVLRPTLLAVLSLATALAAVIGLLIATWRWALRGDREGAGEALRSAPQQLVFDFIAARRRRRAA
jgi:hypothetical protein